MRLFTVAALLFSLTAAGNAAADCTKAARTRATKLSDDGLKAYRAGRNDPAVENFKKAYEACPSPGYLYNLAQIYRHANDNANAVTYYKQYLDQTESDDPRRADAEKWVAQLSPQTAPTPPPAAVTPPPAPVEAPPATTGRNRPVDLGFALGFDSWTSGFNAKSVPAQASFTLAGGYTFGGDVFGSSSFRLGAMVHTVSVNDQDGNSLGFTSWLLEPSVRIRLAGHRLYLTGGLGLGALAISNIHPTSALLAKPTGGGTYKISGTQAGFEMRPAVGLQLHLTPLIVLSVTPALSYSPKKTNFYAAEGRFELMFGLTFQF
jgi:hypothetical protein